MFNKSVHYIQTNIKYLGLTYQTTLYGKKHIKYLSDEDVNILKNFIEQYKDNEKAHRKLLTEKTNLEKYGVKNQFQREDIRNVALLNSLTEEAKEKRYKTTFEKYGTTNTFQLENARINHKLALLKEETKRKIKNTKMVNYGDPNYNNREMYKQTCLEKYGVSSISLTQEYKDIMKLYWLDPDYKQKFVDAIRHTCQTRYGCDSYFLSDMFKKTARRKYNYNNIIFDSGWELSVYIYCVDNNIDFTYHPDIKIPYIVNDFTKYYYPDFIIDGKLIEIKGDQFFRNEKMVNPFNIDDPAPLKKYEAGLANNVTFYTYKDIKYMIQYVLKTYGKDYIKQFKT